MPASTYLRLAAAALLVLAGRLPARAEIRHPDGALPTKLVTYPKSTRPVVVWLAYEGYQPHELPDPDSAAVKPKERIKFMQVFFVAATRNEKDFHLLVTSEDGQNVKDYVGWVPGRYLVRKNTAEIDPETGIMRKALVVNTSESLGSKLDEVMIRHAPLATAPGKDEPQRLYTTMFVFGAADNYVLVGDASSFNPRRDEDAAKVIIGWLPGHRIAIWNTREALEWDHESTLEPRDRPHHLTNVPRPKGPARRTVPGRIYTNEDRAKQSLKAPPVAGIFEEELTPDEGLGYPVSPRLDYNAPRFPVLRQIRGRHPVAGDLFEVGGIGGLCDAHGRLLLSAREVKKFQDTLDALRSQTTQTDLLFVIDDTESMDKWFPVVARTVRKITDLARSERRRQVRVAVSFYNDAQGSAAPGKRPVVETSPLADVVKSGEDIARDVAAHTTAEGGDPHEMVFRGIVESIDAAKFRAHARKLVVVIGDCGDINAVPARRKADPGYVKNYNVEAIVERLVPANLDREAAVEFYAIQVIDPKDSTAASDFKDQMQEVVKQYTERLRERKKKQLGGKFKEGDFRAPAGYFDPVENRGTSVADALAGQYTRLLREARFWEDQINRLKKGQWLTTKLTPEMEQQINHELARRGLKITLEELRRAGGLQLFQTDFVWEKTKEGLPLVRKRVLLNGKELKDLIDLLGLLDNRDEVSLAELLAGIIEKQANTGDRNDPQRLKRLSLKDLLRQSTGLAFRNSLMSKTHEELKGGKGDLQDSEYYNLLHNRALLQDVFEGSGMAYDYEVRYRQRAGMRIREYVRKGDGRDEPRGFHLGNDTAIYWYYLDYDKEWP